MLEIILYFERTAINFKPFFLLMPGLIILLAGLFIWLGGLGLKKILSAVIGALTGGLCGFFIIGRNIISVTALAAFFGFIAVIFERIFLTIMFAALILLFTFAVVTGLHIEAQNSADLANQQVQRRDVPYTAEQTIQIVKSQIAEFTTEIKTLCSNIPVYNWLAMFAAGSISIAAGFFLWRLTCALCCAGWGTIFIFAGMSLLLLCKGVPPVSRIIIRQNFYLAVFAAMIAFGTIVQLLFCLRIKRKSKPKAADQQEQSQKSTPSWRTS